MSLAYYRYQNGFMKLDGSSSYLFPYDRGMLSRLAYNDEFCPEVNIINHLAEEYEGTNKDFVDIGANVGFYSMILAPVFNHTTAFEPSKHIYNILCGNMALHDLSYKTTLYNTGLSDSDVELAYNHTHTGYTGEGGNYFSIPEIEHPLEECGVDNTEVLHVRTLDSYNLDNVGLIKIDVEGMELRVLIGAQETLRRNNYPDIVFESWNPDKVGDEASHSELTTLRSNLFTYLDDLGYDIVPMDDYEVFRARYRRDA